MNRAERLHRPDVLDVYRIVDGYLRRLEAGAVMVSDQRAVAELRQHVVHQIETLSTILLGHSRHSLPSFPEGSQSQPGQGDSAHE